MKKSLILAICILLVCLFMFASCNDKSKDTDTDTHKHSFNYNEWVIDETHHWYGASCEHTDIKLSLGEHIDEDNNGVCDTCEYDYDHEHTYEGTWSTEGANEASHKHFHKASCGHTIESVDVGTYKDENKDGKCDTCEWSNANHTHTYKSEWTTEGTTEANHKHYHKLTCEHTAIGNKDEGVFVDENKDGVCDDCSWYDEAHTHTHSSEFTTEGATETEHKHYYAVSCTHSGIDVKNEGAFVDSNKDGICDVCNWFDSAHTHAYEDEWTINGETEATHTHCYKITCSHTGVGNKNEGSFVDEDKNGVCDTCKWYNENHEHQYASKMTTEGTTEATHKHYYAVICSHTGIGNKNEGSFVDEDKNGVCDTCNWYDEAHTHTYAEAWTTEGTTEGDHRHYYAITCSHTGINLKDEGAFADIDKDGVCNCGWYDEAHTHTYEEAYTQTTTHHGYKPSCSHTGIEWKGYEEHKDEDTNLYCDTCGYDYGHEHTFNLEEWASDSKGHWHPATCIHTDVRGEEAGEEVHKDENKDGVCDICEWYDETHKHTHSDKWSYEGTTESDHKHYYKVTCEHTGIQVKDLGEFSDEDKDGVCTCGWFDEAHEHTYDKEWTVEGTTEGTHKHYKKPSCQHTGIDSILLGEFNDANRDGICDDCLWYDEAHTHAYEEEWTFEGTTEADHKHYYKLICSHTGIGNKNSGTFVDENNDGNCDECNWSNPSHTHTYEDAWTVEGTNATSHKHYHKASCGHTGSKYLEGGLVDENNDGICDTCEASTCNHTYDESKYIYDIDGHWYKPTCGHSVKGSYTAHINTEDGKCDACLAFVDFEAIINNSTSKESANKVVSGTINKVQYNDSATLYLTVNYVFGKDGYLYIEETTDILRLVDNTHIVTVREYWYTVYNNGTLINGMISTNGEEPVPINEEMTLDNASGYFFPCEFIDSAFTAFGVEQLLYKIFNIEVESGDNAELIDGEVICNIDSETGYYTMKVNYNRYTVDIAFTINDDNVITGVKIKTNAEINNMELEINQQAGERTESSPFDPEAGLITEIVIRDDNDNVVDPSKTITIETKDNQSYNFKFTLNPEDYNKSVDKVVAEWDMNEITAYYDNSTNILLVKGLKRGTYSITLKTNLKTIVLMFDVVLPAPTSFEPQVSYDDGGYETITNVDTYVDIALGVGVSVNSGADNGFTAEIISGEGASFEYDEDEEYYVFSSSTAGTYVIKLTSTKDSSITTTLTVTVKEKPIINVAEILSGKYEYVFYDTVMYEMYFIPNQEEATEGTLWFNDLSNSRKHTGVYTYKHLNGTVEVYKDDMTVAPNIIMNISDIGVLTLTTPEYTNSKPSKAEMVADDVLIGKYEVRDSELGLMYIVTFNPSVLQGDNFGCISIKAVHSSADANLTGDYRYEYIDGELVYTKLLNSVPTGKEIPLTIDANLNLVWGDYSITRANFTASEALDGSYSVYKFSAGEHGDSLLYFIKFNYENGTFYLSDYNETEWEGTYEFTYEGGLININTEEFTLYITPGNYLTILTSNTSASSTPVRYFPPQIKGDGSQEYPFEINPPTSTIVNFETVGNEVHYTFVAPATGILTINGILDGAYMLFGVKDAEPVKYIGKGPHDIIVEAGTTYSAKFVREGNVDSFSITAYFEAKEYGSDADMAYDLIEGSNSIVYPENGSEEVYVWYAYEATSDCTITIKNNRFASNIKYGTDLENLTELSNFKRLGVVEISLKAGEKLYFAVQSYDYKAKTHTFTLTTVPKES